MLEVIQHIRGVVPEYRLVEAMTTNVYQSWRQLQDRYTHMRSTFSVDVQTWYQQMSYRCFRVSKTFPIAIFSHT